MDAMDATCSNMLPGMNANDIEGSITMEGDTNATGAVGNLQDVNMRNVATLIAPSAKQMKNKKEVSSGVAFGRSVFNGVIPKMCGMKRPYTLPFVRQKKIDKKGMDEQQPIGPMEEPTKNVQEAQMDVPLRCRLRRTREKQQYFMSPRSPDVTRLSKVMEGKNAEVSLESTGPPSGTTKSDTLVDQTSVPDNDRLVGMEIGSEHPPYSIADTSD